MKISGDYLPILKSLNYGKYEQQEIKKYSYMGAWELKPNIHLLKVGPVIPR